MKVLTRFYIGMSDKNMINQIVHPAEILEYAREEFTGFTTYESKGGWKGKTENSIVLEVASLSEDRAEEVKEELEEKFKQDSVMMARVGADVTF